MKLSKPFTLSIFLLSSLVLSQCKSKVESTESDSKAKPNSLQISLAQWSIHRSIESGELRPEDFASIAKNDFGIDAVEYVATFYKSHATEEVYWEKMKAKADSLGVRSLLIMVDNEGDLGNPNEAERKKAVENHFKWVNAANILGCHSIRINAFGEGTREEVKAAMIDALKQLGIYARDYNTNILIENHGLFSSDGQWVADVITQVNMTNVGTLPDFGNWCTAVKWGTTENNTCAEPYDKYKGTGEMLPFAKGVSAKSYAFDEAGEETSIDFTRMLNMLYQSNFDGYIGIEFEGSAISEGEGIKATKDLLEKTWKEISQSSEP